VAQVAISLNIPLRVKELARCFRKAGFESFLVGGAVRDLLLKRDLADIDIATDATPEDVQRIFRRVVPTGVRHGTVTVLLKGSKFEVTTYRTEGSYSDKRRPDSVNYVASIHEDLKRRDFTINGIAIDLESHSILDPHEGIADLEARLIRAIGDPVKRFSEDALRPLRACRFAAQLDFELEKRTALGIRETRGSIGVVSAERIRDELVKTIQSNEPVKGFELMEELGLLELLLPELHRCVGIEQRERHSYDVFYHSLHSCKAAPRENLVLRMAALFHDLGKAVSLSFDDQNRPTFHGHEVQSSELTKALMRRLKFPNAATREVTHLIRHHMFNYTEEWGDAAVRRFIARVGKDSIGPLVELRIADSRAAGPQGGVSPQLVSFLSRIEAVLAEESAFSRKDLKIDGSEIIRELGIEPGPQVGRILDFLVSAVLEDPKLNEPQRLLSMAGNFYEDRLRKLSHDS
jgi:poly(A) polymerase/tRNA nucleotidyltransferase (CCA-adding enzyme)